MGAPGAELPWDRAIPAVRRQHPAAPLVRSHRPHALARTPTVSGHRRRLQLAGSARPQVFSTGHQSSSTAPAPQHALDKQAKE